MKGIKSYLEKFKCNEPATADTILLAENALGCALPKEYREFLQLSDGGEGFIGEGYAIFWKAEDLERLNREYGIEDFSQEIILIGSNGSEEAFAIRYTDGVPEFIMIPFIFDEDAIIQQGKKFTHLLERLYSDKLFD